MLTNDRIITIGVDQGHLVYRDQNENDAWRVNAKRGDEVQWKSTVGHFTIHFGERSPFAEPKFEGLCGPDGVTKAVRRNASGHYKYFVALVLPGGGPPILDDPEMLID